MVYFCNEIAWLHRYRLSLNNLEYFCKKGESRNMERAAKYEQKSNVVLHTNKFLKISYAAQATAKEEIRVLLFRMFCAFNSVFVALSCYVVY